MPGAGTATPGVDAERVSAYLLGAVPGLTPPLTFRPIAGGRSNLTYEVADAMGVRLILRRRPVGDVLASAHDVRREHRIVAALGETAVPVPEAVALCTDEGVSGAPLFVMGYVEGSVVRGRDDACRLGPCERSRAGEDMAQVLAALHGVDPDAVGLGDLGRQEGYVERQLRRWKRQFDAARDREVPAVDRAHGELLARVPEQHRMGIVHGDFRLDNVVLAGDGSVAAVLDWELCTLGDPRADLGMLLVNWAAPGERVDHLISGTPTAAGGFIDRSELIDRYAQSGQDTAALDYFVALSLWKLACIAEGIRARSEPDAMTDDLDHKVVLLARAALERLSG